MKHDVYISVLLTKDEHKELIDYMNEYMTKHDIRIKQSPMIRQLLLDAIRSKNPIDNKQELTIDKPIEIPIDDKQEDLPTTPHNNDIPLDIPNPYADLHF